MACGDMSDEVPYPQEELQNIKTCMLELQTYIEQAAETRPRFFARLKPFIQKASGLLPRGVQYDLIIQNVDVYLPGTIDAELHKLETASAEIASVGIDTTQTDLRTNAEHILSEVRGIMRQLQNFRELMRRLHPTSVSGVIQPGADRQETAAPFKKSWSRGDENGLTIALLRDIEDVLGRAPNTAEKFSIFEALQDNRTRYDDFMSEQNKSLAYRGYLITLFDHLNRNVQRMLHLVGLKDRVILQSILHFLDYTVCRALFFVDQTKTIQQILSDVMQKYESEKQKYVTDVLAKVELDGTEAQASLRTLLCRLQTLKS